MTAAVENVLNTLGFDGEPSPKDMRALDEAPRHDGDLMSRLDSPGSLPRFPPQEDVLVAIPLPPPVTVEEVSTPTTEARERKPTKERAETPKLSPSVRQLGPVLGKLVPGTERLRVHKRMPNGTRGYVGEYTGDDLNGQDIEVFLARYAQPTHGPGEYSITGLTGTGKELDVGTVTLLGPSTPAAPGSEFVGVIKDLINKQEQQHRETVQMLSQPQIPPPDPINLLKGVMDVQEKVSGQARNEAKGGMGSMVEAMTKTAENNMQMFMAMMQQQAQAAAAAQQQQTQMLVTLMSQPKTDPMMAAILQKLLEKPAETPMMPPPPPPPSVDPMESLEKTIRVVAELMKPKEDPDRLSMRETIELLRVPPNVASGQDDFKRAADNMSVIMNLANSIKQQTEPGASSGFFDALSSLFGNREFVGTLAGAARQKMLPPGQSQAPQQPQVTPQVVQAFRQLQAQVAQQNEILARQAAELEALKKQRLGAASAPEVSTVTATSPEQPEAIEAPPAAQQPQEMPQEVLDHLNTLSDAFLKNDEPAMIEEILNLLETIEGIPGFWNTLATSILNAIEQKNKGLAVEYVQKFFEAMNRLGILGEGVGDKTVALVDEHFDMIAEEVLNDDQD